MKKIILLFVPIIFFGCKTFKNPRYNIKSHPVYCELETGHADNDLGGDQHNNSPDCDSPQQEDLNFSIDNLQDEDIIELSSETPINESLEIYSPETEKTFFSSKTSKREKQNIIERNHNNIKSIIKSSKKNNNTSSGSARGALIFLGVLFTISSLAIIWYVSIIGGVLMLLGGLGMWIGALIMPKPETSVRPSSNRNKTEVPYEQMVDVVYLKNGGIRRGIIVEQVPGESLKIKTNDGSVYVFKMDEISKITKE